jgi:hypothetical protein
MPAVKGLVDVVRCDVELAVDFVEQMVVACPRPIAIAVDEHHVKGEEPENCVEVEKRGDCLLQAIDGRLVENAAEGDQISPGLFLVF